MEIRHITAEDDLIEISNIYESSWKYAYKDMIPQDYLDNIPVGHWVESIKASGKNSIVAIEDGHMIGTASFGRSRWEKYSDYGEIVSIYFLPEYIGRGYGKVLLKICIEELGKLGFHNILLWVLEENHRARSFYEKNGFVCCKEFLNDRIGGKEIKELMYTSNKDKSNEYFDG